MQTFPHFVSKDQSISENCCQDNSGGQVECPLCGMQGSVELKIFSFVSLGIVEATVVLSLRYDIFDRNRLYLVRIFLQT